MGPRWDPTGSCRPQMGPMLAPAMNLAIREYIQLIMDSWVRLQTVAITVSKNLQKNID